MAYVNMYGVLATLENLCEIDEEAKAILANLKSPVSLCFEVANGPCGTFHFTKSGCKFREGSAGCTCKMNFASPEKFNALIDSAKPGIPTKGVVQVLSFLLGPFTKLTDRLTELLRPSEENLKDEAFFEESTILTFYTIAGAITALANSDSISMFTAKSTVDGVVSMGIKDKCYASIQVKIIIYHNQGKGNKPARSYGICGYSSCARSVYRHCIHHCGALQRQYLYGGYDLHG